VFGDHAGNVMQDSRCVGSGNHQADPVG
jgi:hypothetical protein